MFSNFKDAFIRKPQFTLKTPESVLEVLSKDLPEGFRYTEDHDGICRLDCNEIMDFTPVCVLLPEEGKPLFAQQETFSINDVIFYAYNAQKNIEIIPDEDGCFTVNGQKIRADKFIIAPMRNFQLKNGRMYITAPPFPKPVPIEVAGNGFSLTLMVQRQPINSITEVRIMTVGISALNINCTFNRIDKNKKMTITIAICPSSSASEVLASQEIFNAFVQGNGTICGMPIKSNEDGKSNIVSDEVIQFWHKIVEIENVFNVKFDACQEITFDTINKVEELYRCFIKKEPFKAYLRDNTISGTGIFEEILNKEGIQVGNEILFEYVEIIQVILLGVTLRYSALIGVFDGEIGEIRTPEDGTSGEFFLKLIPAKGKRLYASKQYYLNEDAAQTAQKDYNHIQRFKSAQELNNN